MAEIVTDDAAQARKRRIAARIRSTDDFRQPSPRGEGGSDATPEQSKRPRVDAEADLSEESSSASSPDMILSTDANGKPKPHITGIKKQSRYDPGVPMTKEELKAWRKEARRVRNRESAAASRKKNKERITELETEVEVLQTKYAAALKLLLQREAGGQRSMAFVPAVLRQDLMDEALKSGQTSINGMYGISSDEDAQSSSPVAAQGGSNSVAVSPPMSPSVPAGTHEHLLLPPPSDVTTSCSVDVEKRSGSLNLERIPDLRSQSHHHHQEHYQHITPISRPIACV